LISYGEMSTMMEVEIHSFAPPETVPKCIKPRRLAEVARLEAVLSLSQARLVREL
jgi:hypothetical protein